MGLGNFVIFWGLNNKMFNLVINATA